MTSLSEMSDLLWSLLLVPRPARGSSTSRFLNPCVIFVIVVASVVILAGIVALLIYFLAFGEYHKIITFQTKLLNTLSNGGLTFSFLYILLLFFDIAWVYDLLIFFSKYTFISIYFLNHYFFSSVYVGIFRAQNGLIQSRIILGTKEKSLEISLNLKFAHF